MSDIERPRVGTGIWVIKDGKVLMGKRISKFAYGEWCAPGGKVDLNEDPLECVLRETMEEAGVAVKNIRFVAYTNDIHSDVGTHYITLFFVADWKSGEARVMEPDKFETWGWFAWDELPEPMLLSDRNFIE